MPTKRTRVTRQYRALVTPEAVAAYRAGDRQTLHRLLRLPPWQVSPLDTVGVCPWPHRTGGARTWADSIALREALEGADEA